MNRDLKAIAAALIAEIELLPCDDSEFDVEILRFADRRLKYQLHLLPNHGTAQLAADLNEPIQAFPMVEFSFRCTDIIVGTSDYESGIAIRFYEGAVSPAGIRLTMTWTPDEHWYIGANADANPHPQMSANNPSRPN